MLTRAQMKRAAWAVMDWGFGTDTFIHDVAARYSVPKHEIDSSCPRTRWLWSGAHVGFYYVCAVEASILLSEAHRPAGHDGDGTDEL